MAAALAVARLGRRAVLTEETDWIGGQLTAQAFPLEEHPWIEGLGCSRSYQSLRQSIRSYYRDHRPLNEAARADPLLNPGAALASRLACEPVVAKDVLEAMLAPHVTSGAVTLLRRHRAVSVEMSGDRALVVHLDDGETGGMSFVSASYILDATELGDLLPLARVEYVTGAESQYETGEPHAVVGVAQPLNLQAVALSMALDYVPDHDHTISKPPEYDFWRTYKADFEPVSHLSWIHPGVRYDLFAYSGSGRLSLWHQRRVLYRGHYRAGAVASDVTIINCGLNDYWLGPVIEVPADEAERHMEGTKQLSLSLLYWLQTEAPRPDGGMGYPGLHLRPDVVGTGDGLAKFPHIREARRIKAEFTVLEQHISVMARGDEECAAQFGDSVGIGAYRIDLHATTGCDPPMSIATWPFQIPLGSLIPIRVENLLPAAKNIGVTHITNGCYRSHAVEWSVGEAAGTLAAFCIDGGLTPRQVRNTPEHLEELQMLLEREGVDIEWPPVAM